MVKRTINLSPQLAAIEAEAQAMGVSFPALLTADIVHYRRLAEAACPDLTEWQWQCLSRILCGIEAYRVLNSDDTLPSSSVIVAELDEWAGQLNDNDDTEDIARAGFLRAQILEWSPLAIAAVFFVLRTEIAREAEPSKSR